MFNKRYQSHSTTSPRSTLLVILGIVVILGFVVLAFIDVAPPLRTREITIPPERLAK
ncbi:MAG TPA: hypothetical protein VJ890_10590 [Vineibacter sp.]|nr:hypothetical protein [Vineibacter sp.]